MDREKMLQVYSTDSMSSIKQQETELNTGYMYRKSSKLQNNIDG